MEDQWKVFDKYRALNDATISIPEEIESFIDHTFEKRIDRTKRLLNKRERWNRTRTTNKVNNAEVKIIKKGRKVLAAERCSSRELPTIRTTLSRKLLGADCNIFGWE